MKLRKSRIFSFLIILFLSVCMSNAFASENRKRVAVTFTNVTNKQIISPPVLIAHNRNFQLFNNGDAASTELAQLAEDGLTDPLTSYLDGLSSVFDYMVAAGPLLPGESITLEVRTRGWFKFISAAGMLVISNDAFFGMRGVKIPKTGGSKTVYALAYDAGSEANSESCDFIPGPPCMNAEVRDPDMAEGYVYVHGGIKGGGDLGKAFDWRNPVVEITIYTLKNE